MHTSKAKTDGIIRGWTDDVILGSVLSHLNDQAELLNYLILAHKVIFTFAVAKLRTGVT